MNENNIKIRAEVEDHTRKGLDSAKRNLSSLSKDGEKASKDLQEANKKASQSFSAFGDTIRTGAGVALGILGAQMIKVGAQMATQFPRDVAKSILAIDDARSSLIMATGASGEMLKEMTTSAQAVSRVVPQSMGQVASVMGELNTRVGMTGQGLEDMTKQIMDFSRITGSDALSNTRRLGQLINALGLEASDASLLMDKLVFAGIETGISVDRLMSAIVEAGPAFEELGFGLNESIALFSQFEKFGARPEEIISSLNIAMNKMAREGFTDANEAFSMYLQQIKDAPTILEATTIASELFGSRVGSKVAEDIRAGRFEVDEFVKALESVGGMTAKIADESLTASQKIGMVWKGAVESTAGFLVDGLIEPVGRFSEALNNNTKLTELNAKTIQQWGKTGVDSIKDHRDNIHRLTATYDSLEKAQEAYNKLLHIASSTGESVVDVNQRVVDQANNLNLSYEESLNLLREREFTEESAWRVMENQRRELEAQEFVQGELEKIAKRRYDAERSIQDVMRDSVKTNEDLQLSQIRINRERERLNKLIQDGKAGTDDHIEAEIRLARAVREHESAQKQRLKEISEVYRLRKDLGAEDLQTLQEQLNTVIRTGIENENLLNNANRMQEALSRNIERTQTWERTMGSLSEEQRAMAEGLRLLGERVHTVRIRTDLDDSSIANIGARIQQAFSSIRLPSLNVNIPGLAQLSRLFGRASGGTVVAGQPYMVGEMGREVFVPDTNGKIVNNSETNNISNNKNVTVNINGGDTMTIRRELERILAN